MTPSARDDLALKRRLLAGDEEAFERFFAESFPRVFRYALAALGRDPEEAREVAQATLCKAIDRLESFRGDSPLLVWLLSICRNEIVDGHRRRARTVELLEDRPGIRQALEALAGGTLSGADPEDRLLSREARRLVHAVLDHMPGQYGTALELRYLQGCSVPEIATRLQLSYKAAESVLSRARRAFREAFEPFAAEGLTPFRKEIP